jgi:hypothetical protein
MPFIMMLYEFIVLEIRVYIYTHTHTHTHTINGGYTLVTLPRTVTPYRDSVDGTGDHVTYKKLVKRSFYGHVRCDAGIWPSHQRDDAVRA